MRHYLPNLDAKPAPTLGEAMANLLRAAGGWREPVPYQPRHQAEYLGRLLPTTPGQPNGMLGKEPREWTEAKHSPGVGLGAADHCPSHRCNPDRYALYEAKHRGFYNDQQRRQFEWDHEDSWERALNDEPGFEDFE